MKDLDVLNQMKTTKICGIIRKVSSEEAKGITGALIKGGVSTIEVAFNTKGATEIIQALKAEFGNEIVVGAGTVLDSETARTAILAGADFILSPTLHIDVIKMCQKYNVLAVPGAYSPTEILQAWEAGARIVKVFPAVTLTSTFIKQVKGPLDQIELMAVGGVNGGNLTEFIHAGAACVGIGSEMTGLHLIENGDYSAITERAKSLVQLTT